jgi:NADP-dependent 3-hydroxy acid dehydrogenase YdfG
MKGSMINNNVTEKVIVITGASSARQAGGSSPRKAHGLLGAGRKDRFQALALELRDGHELHC